MVPIEYPYLSDIGALMYLTNNTRPNIVFTVNYLIRYLQCVIGTALRRVYSYEEIKNTI
jgi:hypothetical protein